MFPTKARLRSNVVVDQAEIGGYYVDFLRGGEDLVFTFENAEPTLNRADRMRDAWSFRFLARRGYSVFGVKPQAIDWFRGPAIHEWFRSKELAAFISSFRRVIFTGSSMGGYAAATFSRIAPGSLVLAFNPQSTLDPHIAGWDRRFPHGTKQNWNGDFADAADAIPLAKRVYISYDPFDPTDFQHAKRLEHPNVEHLKMPFLGHPTPLWLGQLGLLEQTSVVAFNETLTSEMFAKWIRKRRTIPHYYITASRRLTSVGRHAAAISVAAMAVRLQPNQDAYKALEAAKNAGAAQKTSLATQPSS